MQSPSAVPPTSDSFHGRVALMGACVELLSGATRIVALSGAPGSGKSRLANEIARRVALPTSWMDLHEAATTENVEEHTLRRLGDILDGAQGPQLVVLDGIDRVTPGALGVVDAGRSRWRGARWLLTARACLDIDGAVTRRLDPMAPDPAHALFQARARARSPDITSAPAAASAVARLCAALDHNPLAIEHAAAFAPVFGVGGLSAQIATTVFDGTGAPPRGPSHHQSLAAAVAWTFHELAVPHHRAAAQWSVFEAPFGVEAACAVSGLDPVEVQRSTHALCAANLARRDTQGRVALGFATRVLAARALQESGASAKVRDAHATWFLSQVGIWAERHGSGWNPDVSRWIREHWRDVRVALVRLAPREPTTVAAGLARLTPLRAGAVGPTLVADVVSALPMAQLPAPIRGRVLCHRGEAHARSGRRQAAHADLDTAAALAQAGPSQQLMDEVTWRRGRAHHILGRTALAATVLDALQGAPPTRDPSPHWRRVPLDRGIVAAALGRYADAEVLLQRALSGASTDPLTMVATRYELGWLALRKGDISAAEAPLEAAVAEFGALGIPSWQSMAQARLAAVHVEHGRLEQAWRAYDQALRRLKGVDVPRFVATVWTELGLARLKTRDPHGARQAAKEAIQAAEHRNAPAQQVSARVLAAVCALVEGRVRRARVEQEVLHGLGIDLSPSLTWQVDVVDAWLKGRVVRRPRTLGFPDRWLLAIAPAASAGHGTDQLEAEAMRVAHDGRWFQPPGADLVDLSRKGPARRLVAALVAHQHAVAGRGLEPAALVAAGWPDQRLDKRTAANRLHVTLAGLRKLGFGPFVERISRAYRLHPEVQIVEAP